VPSSPTIQYHLGMTAQKVGDKALAREALTNAANSTTAFAERDEARKALEQLK